MHHEAMYPPLGFWHGCHQQSDFVQEMTLIPPLLQLKILQPHIQENADSKPASDLNSSDATASRNVETSMKK